MTQTALLTRDEAAERLRVSSRTVDRLRCSGDITDVRVGKRGVRVDRDSVEAYLRANRRLPPGARTPEPSP